MKCKRTYCEKEAARGQAYCSRDCAPLAHLAAGGPTRSTPKAASSTPARGVQSQRSSTKGSGVGSVSESAGMTPKAGSTTKQERLPISSPTRSESRSGVSFDELTTQHSEIETTPEDLNMHQNTEPLSASELVPGIGETSSMPVVSSTTGDSSEIPSTDSRALSTEPAGETPHSVKLIDESILHMHGLMKRVAPLAGGDDVRNHFRMVDPRQVHAAVGCAATIYKLMRLRLDIVKGALEAQGGKNADRRT